MYPVSVFRDGFLRGQDYLGAENTSLIATFECEHACVRCVSFVLPSARAQVELAWLKWVSSGHYISGGKPFLERNG